MLFSATSTQKIDDLARLALKKEPIAVGVENTVQEATVAGLEQGTTIHTHYKQVALQLNCYVNRLRRLSGRETFSNALLFPKKEQKEEDNGVFQLLPLCEIPSRVA